MEQKIQETLKRWESSLLSYGKVDQWHVDEDYVVIRDFLTYGKSAAARNAVRDCRDYSIRSEYDVTALLKKVQNANRILNKPKDCRINNEIEKINSVGQAKRYSGVTGRLYNEKIRFLDGEYLKNVDISMKDGATSRKVRRIVEKRMCQAYHRQNKEFAGNGGKERHYMRRATSFQLHNLGQIDCSNGIRRTTATHWKRVFDSVNGGYVLKSKMEYQSFDDANMAARKYMTRNPNELLRVSAYQCAYCGKWHIGHERSDDEIIQETMNLEKVS